MIRKVDLVPRRIEKPLWRTALDTIHLIPFQVPQKERGDHECPRPHLTMPGKGGELFVFLELMFISIWSNVTPRPMDEFP